MDSERYVHGLEETSSSKPGADVVAVACHPTLPILVTGTKCGQVCLWNSTRPTGNAYFFLLLSSIGPNTYERTCQVNYS